MIIGKDINSSLITLNEYQIIDAVMTILQTFNHKSIIYHNNDFSLYKRRKWENDLTFPDHQCESFISFGVIQDK